MVAAANPHVQAVIDLLEAAAVGTSLTVYDGQADNLPTTPYVVVYPDPGMATMSTMWTSSHFDQTIQITAVGASRWQAGWAADLAKGALVDVTPTVAGRSAWPIRQIFARPVHVDVDDPDLFVAMVGIRVRSD